jgi:uncharacterized membrane protein YeiH
LSIIEVAEIVGILSFSLSGFFIAASSKLDILGVLIASFLTALGGGVIRDVLAQRELYAFTNNLASILVISVVFIAIVLKLQRFKELEKSTSFMVVDSLGLVSFAISGALVGVEAEFNFFGVILLSLITAVGGGVLRDMLINKVPMILVSEFYGSVAIVVGLLVYVFASFDMLNFLTILNVFFAGLALRYVAIKRDWHLPKIL